MQPRLLAALLICFGLLSSGCPNKETLGFSAISVLGEGVINDPKNKSLRFDLLKFGLDRFCEEMKVRGIPLKLRDDEPVLGRFFAESCESRIIDEERRQSLVVQFRGRGFGWTNVTQRLGFASAGLIEYAPDFQVKDESMYIYFRPRNIDSTSFQTTLMESALARTGVAITGINPDQIGRNILESQLKRGFTVIRYSKHGETELGMGMVAVGQRPFHPFTVVSSDKITLDNDRTEVHSGQQEFIGGFNVEDDDQALYLTVTIDGAPGVDLFILQKSVGDQVITNYVQRAGPASLTAPPLMDEAVTAGQRWQRTVRVPRGQYYLMVDHTPLLGRTAPPAVAGDDRAAKIDYLVQLGDAP